VSTAVGTATNAVSTAVGTAGNNFTIAVGAASNGRANIVGTAGNNYTNAISASVGTAGNNFTAAVGIAGNNYTNAIGIAGNNYAVAISASVGTAGNNFTAAVGIAGNNYTNTVGTAGNNYTNAVGAASNTIAIAAFAKANSTSYTSNLVISVADNTNAALRITQTGTGEAIRVEDEANPDSTPFVVTATGNVLVGRTTDSTVGLGVKLDVNGAINASVVIATDFNSTSDIKLKSNVHTLNNGLKIINNINPVSFNWNGTEKLSYGVIAQEIERVLPELVAGLETKHVSYIQLIAFLISAIKELDKKIEELKK
jgi:hypothetical protein